MSTFRSSAGSRKTAPVSRRGRLLSYAWLGGFLILAACLALPSRPSSKLPKADAPLASAVPAPSRSSPTRKIEDVRVGQRVVTDSQRVDPQPTAVNPKTWQKVVLRAEWRWKDGTLDDINVETLQPREWFAGNGAHVGGMVPLPLDLVEMGLPRDLYGTVLSVEPCPPIPPGRGRMVLTTVNHLNPDVREIAVTGPGGSRETIGATATHRFYSANRGGWISAYELQPGDELSGVRGAMHVAGISRISGVRRVYNMTVEDEHVYRVSALGVLVHNMCASGDAIQTGGNTIKKSTADALNAANETNYFSRDFGRALENIKGDRGLANNFHETKIFANGDVLNSNTAEWLGNLFDNLF